MKTRMLGVLALGLITAACGVTQEERVTGGAAAGAATGAGVGALGGPPGVLAGAAIGAGAGAATGALTEPSTVNLGEPPWSNPDARVPGVTGGTARSGTSGASRGSGMASAQVRDLQRTLNNRGYAAGPADGVYGPRTREAVTAWQRANNMQATGRPTPQMMATLGIADSATGGSTDRNRAYMGGGMVGGGSGPVQSRGTGDALQDRVRRPGMEPDPNAAQDVSPQ
jgi:peptidoglycan hydrolase-like protein with peptidoglycan-binding domain